MAFINCITEILSEKMVLQVKNRWGDEIWPRAGNGSSARSHRSSELASQFSQPLQVALSHCRAFCRCPRCQILRLSGVKWSSLHFEQYAAWFQCDHGMPGT